MTTTSGGEPIDTDDLNVVVVHDGAIHPGGAVAVAIQATWALDADLIVGFSGVPREWWAERVPNDVNVLTIRSRRSVLKDARVAWKLRNLNLAEYDIVLTSGPSAKFYQPKEAQQVTHYMHHPPHSVLWGDKGLRAYLVRTIDRIETWSIPRIIANSELTADRIQTFYNRDVDAVIHPPVEIERFSTRAEKNANEVVMVGRIEERKRPELALEAFERLAAGNADPPMLHVLGEGPLRSTLERQAPSNVTFHGYVNDDELVRLIEQSAAGLFLSRREDFGITPVEYMAAGTPVVGVNEPNTNNQVTDGENGVLVEPTADSVAEGIHRALDRDWDADAIRAQAEEYRVDRYRDEIRAELLQ